MCLTRLGRQQAVDSELHVRQPAGRVQPRRDRESEVGRARRTEIPLGDLEQGANARARSAAPHAPQPLRDENPVIEVERHHVGDGTQRDQVERRRDRGASPGRVDDAAFGELAGQCRHDVESNPDAGETLAGKRLVRKVRIHDTAGFGKFRTREVVVRHDDIDAAGVGLAHPLDARDAIVHRDDQVRLEPSSLERDLR